MGFIRSSNQGINKKGKLSMQANYRVNLGFAGYSDSDLDEFTSSIISCLTGNASFPTPPVALTDLGTLQTTFETAMATAAQGGTALTAAKNVARAALVTALRKTATYVQGIAGQDSAMMLTSGFYVNSTNRAQQPLAVPTIVSLSNGATTQLTVRLQPVTNARAYQVRTSTNGGTAWQLAVDSTQARQIILTDLTPGTTYTVQSRAVGGATGYSDWSDPVSHMAM
jgi:Fibronectin type III domain